MNSSSSLPPGWTSAIDPSSGRVYYANSTTGESSWELPTATTRDVDYGHRPSSSSSVSDYRQDHARHPDYHQNQRRPDYHHHRQPRRQEHHHQPRAQQHQQQQEYRHRQPPQRQPFESPSKQQQHHHPTRISQEHHDESQQQQQPHQQRQSTPSTTQRADASAATTVSVSSIKALASSGLLVPAASAIVDCNHDVNARKDMELYGLSAGQLADLCVIQREEMLERQVEFQKYTPITPQALSNSAKRPVMEPGRLEIRLHSLYKQLRKIKD